MAEAADCAAWDRAAILWHIIAEANRDPREQPKPFLPSDRHPYRGPQWCEPDNGQVMAIAREMAERAKHGN